MNILVTGAATPFGRALIDELLAGEDVDRVLAVGRAAEHARSDRRVVYHRCDLAHARDVHDLLYGPAKALGVEAVVHAAELRTRCCDAARGLAVGCAAHPTIRRLVYRSFAEVYAPPRGTTSLLDEDAPLAFARGTPSWVRDRVEADITIGARRDGPLAVVVLRFAELFAPECGSQLWDYLASRVCFRVAGFDPMLNLLALGDAVAAAVAALRTEGSGVFNIPGCDTLPLSRAIAESGRMDLPVPGAALAPLYALRRAVTKRVFRYDRNVHRFHVGCVLDGTHARERLGYTPRAHVEWPAA